MPRWSSRLVCSTLATRPRVHVKIASITLRRGFERGRNRALDCRPARPIDPLLAGIKLVLRPQLGRIGADLGTGRATANDQLPVDLAAVAPPGDGCGGDAPCSALKNVRRDV